MSDEKIIEGITLDAGNKKFFQAAELVMNSNQDIIYITGKAGTGKTTFLEYIREEYRARVGNVVVLAPTGVAAVNAGGQTIHSFFKLQSLGFAPIPPNDTRLEKPKIYEVLGYNKEKRKIIKAMSLLIIDEVSMVRCDVLDAIDRILRVYRNPARPFGGVKVLLIGDAFQLPPVVTGPDWNILKEFYPSGFFFDAQVYRGNDVTYIELDKPYRQTESEFLNILDNIRVGGLGNADLAHLNERCTIPDMDSCIVLASKNEEVDMYNMNEYNKITAREVVFEATVEGVFKDRPAPEWLRLKVGTRVMILRNKYGGDHFEYFNGSIGKISAIDEDQGIVKVILPEGEVNVGRERWENNEYKWDSQNQCVCTKVVGTYTQFPLKWAWAITIHKSQGLTFDKVYADLSECFAPGQAYVALSRCRRLRGLYLKNPLRIGALMVNNDVVEFSKQRTPDVLLVKQIEWGKADRLYKKSREALWQNEPAEMLDSLDKAVKIRDDRDTDAFRKAIRITLALFHFKRQQSQQYFAEICKLRSNATERLKKEAEMASNAKQLSSDLQSQREANINLSEKLRALRKEEETIKRQYEQLKMENDQLSEKIHALQKECERLRRKCELLESEAERLRSMKWYQKLFGKK